MISIMKIIVMFGDDDDGDDNDNDNDSDNNMKRWWWKWWSIIKINLKWCVEWRK